MRRTQGRGQPERRSARLSKTRKRREAEEPSESQNLKAYFASGSEEELVVVQHQVDPLITQGFDHHSTPYQSSPGRLEGTEGTDLNFSSEDSDSMPTTTRLKYSRFRGDGSQDVDDWFPEQMGFQIRQTRPGNLQQAMEVAQNYENSAQSLRKSLKRSKEKDKGKGRKKDRKG